MYIFSSIVDRAPLKDSVSHSHTGNSVECKAEGLNYENTFGCPLEIRYISPVGIRDRIGPQLVIRGD
jgi:hypothetical protein